MDINSLRRRWRPPRWAVACVVGACDDAFARVAADDGVGESVYLINVLVVVEPAVPRRSPH